VRSHCRHPSITTVPSDKSAAPPLRGTLATTPRAHSATSFPGRRTEPKAAAAALLVRLAIATFGVTSADRC
jgi:hypothetical protein